MHLSAAFYKEIIIDQCSLKAFSFVCFPMTSSGSSSPMISHMVGIQCSETIGLGHSDYLSSILSHYDIKMDTSGKNKTTQHESYENLFDDSFCLKATTDSMDDPQLIVRRRARSICECSTNIAKEQSAEGDIVKYSTVRIIPKYNLMKCAECQKETVQPANLAVNLEEPNIQLFSDYSRLRNAIDDEEDLSKKLKEKCGFESENEFTTQSTFSPLEETETNERKVTETEPYNEKEETVKCEPSSNDDRIAKIMQRRRVEFGRETEDDKKLLEENSIVSNICSEEKILQTEEEPSYKMKDMEDLEDDLRDDLIDATERPALRMMNLSTMPMAVAAPSVGKIYTEAIVLESVEIFISENGRTHHTTDYKCMQYEPKELVCRRGFPFIIQLRTNRPLDINYDDVLLSFFNNITGERAITTWGVRNFYTTNITWKSQMRTRNDRDLLLEIQIPSNSSIGEYEVWFDFYRYGSFQRGFKDERKITILFNPWNEEDETYFDDDPHLLNEYILDSMGYINRGQQRLNWLYDQFDEICLRAAFKLLRVLVQQRILRSDQLGSAVAIMRAFTYGIPQYVLYGKWDALNEKDISMGAVNAHFWHGSRKIFEHFLLKDQPALYGQCWCFGAVFTTLSRSLGVPCRTVTNIESGHDVEGDLTIKIYDYRIQPKGDSIWNFHVWNEIYVKRLDLSPNYNGWQVCDSTPQERSKSSGLYQCGPFPVAALHEGNLHPSYDGVFIYGEVNSDVYFYANTLGERSYGRSNYDLVARDTQKIGEAIFTVDPYNHSNTWNIVNYYKWPEGTAEEREQHQRALICIGANEWESLRRYRRAAFDMVAPDIEMEFDQSDHVNFGDPLNVRLRIKNGMIYLGLDALSVSLKLRVVATTYTGSIQQCLVEEDITVKLKPDETRYVEFSIAAENYIAMIPSEWSIKLVAIAKNEETNKIVRCSRVLNVVVPSLILTVEQYPSECSRTIIIRVQMSNPSSLTFSRGTIQMDGDGIDFGDHLTGCPDVPPGGNLDELIRGQCNMASEQNIVALYSCNLLKAIRGYLQIRL
ncbi:hypothetical protein AB6A40_005521 [Gnathostoma spinigerum]|uniref:Transglutaminase-like domain-containing protein n=1 Tax=Gnathostoma spinigerum TaxID=75299 RepID=A0ABD6EQ50_9BILA